MESPWLEIGKSPPISFQRLAAEETPKTRNYDLDTSGILSSSGPDLRNYVLDGNGPFTPAQYQRLYVKATSQLTVADRLEDIDSKLVGAAEERMKLRELIETLSPKISDLELKLQTQQDAGLARQEEVQKKIEGAIRLAEQQSKTVQERMSLSMSELGKRLQQYHNEGGIAQETCTERFKTVDFQFDQLQQKIDDVAAKQFEDHGEITTLTHARFAAERLHQEGTFASLQNQMQQEAKGRRAVRSLLEGRLDELESVFQTAADGTAKTTKTVQEQFTVLRQQLADHHASRDSDRKAARDSVDALTATTVATENALRADIARVERLANDVDVRRSQESTGMRVSLEHTQERLREEREDRCHMQEQITQLSTSMSNDISTLRDAISTARAELQFMQLASKSSFEKLEGKIESLVERQGVALEATKTVYVNLLSEEGRKREAQVSCLNDDIRELKVTCDAVNAACGHESAGRLAADESLQSAMEADREASKVVYDAFQERLDGTTRSIGEATTSLERLLRQVETGTRERENVENGILEQVAAEKAARLRSHEDVQELFQRLKDAVEANKMTTQHNLSGRLKAIHKSVASCHEFIRKEIEEWAAEAKNIWRSIAALKEQRESLVG